MLRILTKTETQPIARSVPEKAAAGSVRTGWSRRCATSQVGPGSGKHHHGPMAPWGTPSDPSALGQDLG